MFLVTVAGCAILATVVLLYRRSQRAARELRVVKRQLKEQLNDTRRQFEEEWAAFDDGSDDARATIAAAARAAATHRPAKPLKQPQLPVSPRLAAFGLRRRRVGAVASSSSSLSLGSAARSTTPSARTVDVVRASPPTKTRSLSLSSSTASDVRGDVAAVRDASSRLDHFIHDDVLRPIFEPYGEYVRGPLKSVSRAVAKARTATRRRRHLLARLRGIDPPPTEYPRRVAAAATRPASRGLSTSWPRRDPPPRNLPAQDYGGDARRVLDYVRGTATFSSPGAFRRGLETMEFVASLETDKAWFYVGGPRGTRASVRPFVPRSRFHRLPRAAATRPRRS